MTAMLPIPDGAMAANAAASQPTPEHVGTDGTGGGAHASSGATTGQQQQLLPLLMASGAAASSMQLRPPPEHAGGDGTGGGTHASSGATAGQQQQLLPLLMASGAAVSSMATNIPMELEHPNVSGFSSFSKFACTELAKWLDGLREEDFQEHSTTDKRKHWGPRYDAVRDEFLATFGPNAQIDMSSNTFRSWKSRGIAHRASMLQKKTATE
jgi:hypothetical protein